MHGIDPIDPVEQRDDQTLMVRVQSGDEPAFAELMNRWEVPIKAVIGRLVLNTSEAEELAQETFVRLWQQRARYNPGQPFKPWILAIAVNLARNRLRWWRRRPNVSLDAWTDDSPGLAPHERLASGETPVPQALERAEVAAAVRAAIAQLPADLREALVLFEYEQLSQGEIATIVGGTVKAVESRIYRARERLRVLLRGLAPPGTA